MITPKLKIPKYYTIGTRLGQILHTRLRMNCSSLKRHLYYCNLESDPYCQCENIESNSHYLLSCKNYDQQRLEHLYSLNLNLSSNLLLFGDENLNYETNAKIFIHVQKFILASKRFG